MDHSSLPYAIYTEDENCTATTTQVQGATHCISSFVVFYFVFVLWLLLYVKYKG